MTGKDKPARSKQCFYGQCPWCSCDVHAHMEHRPPKEGVTKYAHVDTIHCCHCHRPIKVCAHVRVGFGRQYC